MVAVVVDSAAAAALPLHPPASPCAGGRAYRAIVVTLLTATLLTLAMLSQTGGRNCQQLHSTPGIHATASSTLVVLAHSEQSTLWARGVPNAVVYSSTDAVGSRKVEGKGFEARAYLQAIVDHWDALPEAMAFVHAHNRSWHVKVGNGKLNSSEWKLTHLRWPTLEYYTPLSCTSPIPPGWMLKAEEDPAHGVTVEGAWKEHFGKWLGDMPEYINAPCCAEFLVTRTAILQLPKAFYEGTLAWFDSSHEESKRVGWIMEYVWHILFTKGHRPVYKWNYEEATCLCYLYGIDCDSPDALFHHNLD